MSARAIWADIWAEIRTPSGADGPLGAAYQRAVVGMAHVALGGCLIAMASWSLVDLVTALRGMFPLVGALIYWLAKECGDLRRGGSLWDGLEDTLCVWIGAYYAGQEWWPALTLGIGGYLMAAGAWRRR